MKGLLARLATRRGLAFAGVTLAFLVIVPWALAAAINSTVDPGQTVGGKTTLDCVHGGFINCNDYVQKQDVFLSGSPSKDVAGTYFFAVLAPGGQPNANDGGAKNLSDTNCLPYTGCPGPTNGDATVIPIGDSAANREFSADSHGNITNLGSHHFDSANNSLSVWPFDDTTNNGGVYILAVCKISDDQNTSAITVPTVKGSDCKFDAFKVEPAGGVHTAGDLTVVKDATATFDQQYKWTVAKSVDKSEFDQSTTTATPTYTITVSHDDGSTKINYGVSGTITVFNPNDDPVLLDSVTDSINDPNASCTVTGGTNVSVLPGSTPFDYSCSYSAAPSSLSETNTAKIVWSTQALPTDGSLTGNNATFDVDFTFASTGTFKDTCTTVTDDFNGAAAPGDTLGVACVDGTWTTDAGNTLTGFTHSYDTTTKEFTLSYTRSLTGTAGTCTTYDNTATSTANDTGSTDSDGPVEVKVCVGKDLTVTKTATPAFKRTIGWSITKDVDKTSANIASGGTATFNYTVKATHDSGTDSGWQVTGTITVSNPNDWESVKLTNVTDAIDHSGTCSITSGDTGTTLAAKGQTGDSTQLGYKCTFTANPGSGTNTGTATWDKTAAHTPNGTKDGTATYDFSAASPTVVDNCTDVTDKFNGGSADDLGTVCADGTSSSLNSTLDNISASYTAPTWTFTYSRSVSGVASTCTKYDNTAKFTTSDTSATGTAGKEVTVCVGSDLTVTKTATPAFTRDYDWSVVKSQTTSSTPIDSSASSVNVAYKVQATWSGPTDSGWQVTGTITVSNPNDWESIALTGVTDTIDHSGTCLITSGSTTATLAAKGHTGDSTMLGYKCTFTSNPGSGTNTGTATWDKTLAYTPHGTKDGTATYDFGPVSPTVTHNTTTVKDAFNGGTANTLGVANINGTFTKDAGNTLASWTQAYDSPSKTFTFTYTRPVPVVANTCKTYNNTATVSDDATGADNSSNASVTICGPVTGGLTMGFWQNKNGQAIITGGASTSGVCNSGTWLRNFNPFKDLSATASCSQVATYVTNVIKAATCSTGGTCNTMLKAQMLATALDVYFSDGTLGGNKISAPTALGAVTVDLTKICKMVDSSSSSSCPGSFESAQSVFITGGQQSVPAACNNPSPGATSMTVLCILWNGASNSNSGGGTWYGNVKATQVVAKDTYDAINNAAAFA